MRQIIVATIILLSAACAKSPKDDEQTASSTACTPIVVNGVTVEGWHEFGFNDVRWAKGFQCGTCEKFIATTGAPTEDLRCN